MQAISRRDGTLTNVTITCDNAQEIETAAEIVRKLTTYSCHIRDLTVSTRTNKRDAADIVAGVAAHNTASAAASRTPAAGSWGHRVMIHANPLAESLIQRDTPAVRLANGQIAKFSGFGREFYGREIDGSEFDGTLVRYAYYR